MKAIKKIKAGIKITVVVLLLCSLFYPQYLVTGEVWENEWGRLEVYPDVSNQIIRQVQYCNFTSYMPDNTEIDVVFRFDFPLTYKNIWIWKNISHDVKVYDYGWIEDNYTLVNISGIEVIQEPDYLDFGDIPSNYYRRGNASYWNDILHKWQNGTFQIGFDNFEWLNPEHTKAIFFYEYWGITGNHTEQQYWFDWDNIKSQFKHKQQGNNHYYYIRFNATKDKIYQLKWEYDVPIGSNGKWDLLAKKSSDPIGSWKVSIDPWWNSNWQNSKRIDIANKIDDFQMRLDIGNITGSKGNFTLEGHLGMANWSNIRFVNSTNTSEIYHWRENYTKDVFARFWIKNMYNESSIWCYYNNSNVLPNTSFNSLTDTMIDAEPNAGGSASWTGANVVESDDTTIYRYGTSSVKFTCNDADWEQSTRPFDNSFTSGKITIDFITRPHGGDHFYNLLTETTVYSAGVSVYTRYAMDVWEYQQYDGGWSQILDNPTNDTWYKFTMDLDLDSPKIDRLLVDYDTRLTGEDFWNQDDLVYFFIRVYNTGNYGHLDSFWFRMYRKTEPSWSGFGSEQTAPSGNNNPTVSNPYPSDGATEIPINFVHFNITVNDLDGDNMNITWRTNCSPGFGATGEWHTLNTTSNVGNGTYYAYNTSFVNQSGTKYWWSVNVSDGNGGWLNTTYDFTTVTIGTLLSGAGADAGWRKVSLPKNSIEVKYDVYVRNSTNNYTWSQAISNNIISTWLYSWNDTNGYYESSNYFSPYRGYWMFLYDLNYDLWISGAGSGGIVNISVNRNLRMGLILTFSLLFTIVGLIVGKFCIKGGKNK